MTFSLSSSAFDSGGDIPAEHTDDGGDSSPPLAWEDAPRGTRAFALICDDPDAPREEPWVHWVVYGMPAAVSSLPGAVDPGEIVATGGIQGTNSWERLGYGGPAPPPGKPHRYVFRLYALDEPTRLSPGATKDEVLEAIEGHVLAEAELVGTYGR